MWGFESVSNVCADQLQKCSYFHVFVILEENTVRRSSSGGGDGGDGVRGGDGARVSELQAQTLQERHLFQAANPSPGWDGLWTVTELLLAWNELAYCGCTAAEAEAAAAVVEGGCTS